MQKEKKKCYKKIFFKLGGGEEPFFISFDVKTWNFINSKCEQQISFLILFRNYFIDVINHFKVKCKIEILPSEFNH